MTALVMMRNGAVLTNSGYRTSTGVQDSRAATRELRELVDAGVVEQAGTRGSTTYQLAVKRDPAAAGLTGNEVKIMEALGTGSLTRAELEESTGLSKDQVQHALQTLRQKGLVRLLGKPRSRVARWSRA
ncbi:MarR family transcriptional regulator [Actinoplanes utahensis]|uniref:HTH marR-type domain-containing protein n=1 Tax=Actinoplanes utahensis TaxID=1869 RepID=A0A0A6UUB9_ACTUT|nr:MarR family transcriptional regulator [Actinoplanes utahensis]KHD79001.1 hypothetical protein MB27_02730 [Actinoplanes utahensis]GIF28001.1 hypothetical protein Aut01nite_09870 [Actinoplanes utahensis]